MSKRLEHRVASVTGSSSGNGRAIALALAREGASVVCADLEQAAQKAGYKRDPEINTDALITQSGGQATFITSGASVPS